MKGISPFISAIFLIAFVVAVGAIASPWFISFMKSRSSEVEDISEDQIDCIFSSIEFTSSDMDYNITGASDSLNITLENTGSVPLYNFEIIMTLDSGTNIYQPTSGTARNSTNPLEAGDTMILITNITDSLSGTLEKVKVVAKNCPQEARKEVAL